MLIHFKPHQSIWNQRLSMTRLRNRCHQRVAFRHGARTTPHLRKRPNGGCWQVIELNDWGTLKPETHQKQTPIFHRNYHDFNWFQISGEDFPSNPLICWSWARGNLFHVPIFFDFSCHSKDSEVTKIRSVGDTKIQVIARQSRVFAIQ